MWKNKQTILISLYFLFIPLESVFCSGNACEKLLKIQLLDNKSAYCLIDLLQKCYDEVDGKNMGVYCATALNLYAWYVLQTDENVNSVDLFMEALKYCPKESEQLHYYILSGLAGSYIYNKEYTKAESLFKELLDYYKKKKSNIDILTTSMNMGTFYKNINNKSKALYYYRAAMDIAWKMKAYSYYCNMITYVASLKDDSYIKPNMIKKGIDLAFKYNIIEIQPENYIALSDYYSRQTDYVKAINNADKALQYAQQLGDKHNIIESYNIMAKEYYLNGDYEMAANCYRQVKEVENNHKKEIKLKSFKDQAEAQKLVLLCHDYMNEKVELPVNYYSFWIVIIVLVIVLTVCGYVILKLRKHNAKLISEENENKDESIEMQNAKLHIHYLQLFYDNQNVLLDKIKEMLHSIKGLSNDQNMQIKKINNFMTQNKLQKKDDELYKEFEQEDNDFVSRLEQKHPELTQSEKRLALLLKMDLSSRDIALLTGNQITSIKMSRYRLRKTLRLSSEDDMVEYLKKI